MSAGKSDQIFHVNIGEAVRQWRQAQQMTLTALAEAAGPPITKGYISQLENGKIHRPGDDHLIRIARALGIPVMHLVTRHLPGEGPFEEAGAEQGDLAQQGAMRPRGRRIPAPRRTAGDLDVETQAAATGGDADRERELETLARRLASDSELADAIRHLQTAVADPQMRPAVLNALAAFARAARPEQG